MSPQHPGSVPGDGSGLPLDENYGAYIPPWPPGPIGTPGPGTGPVEPTMPPPVPAEVLKRDADLLLWRVQMLLRNPYVQTQVVSLLDRMMRFTWKPSAPPPWHEPPYDAWMWHRYDYESRAATGAWAVMNGAVSGNFSHTVPEGWTMVLRTFGQDLDDADQWAAGNVRYRFTVDNVPVRGYESWDYQYGQTESRQPMFLIVKSGQTWQYEWFNGSPGALVASASVTGWLWRNTYGQHGDDTASAHSMIA